MAETRDGIPVMEVYWRPGCPFCFGLRQALVRARMPVTWHNIWADPQHAAFVRSVAGGNETVPTVVLDGTPHVNPGGHKLLGMVNRSHPDLPRLPSWWSAWRAFRRDRRR